MITILSPAKSLNFSFKNSMKSSQAVFGLQAKQIMNKLRDFSPNELKQLMNISDKLALLNTSRHSEWNFPGEKSKSLAAIFAFNGEVYNGLKARELNENQMTFAQEHIRIISGLYGILKPLDEIMAYRLEMGTPLSIDQSDDLYEFWKAQIQKEIIATIKKQSTNIVLNLASKEYAKAVIPFPATKKIRVVEAQFYEDRKTELKMVSIFAKKARGLMTRFIIENEIDDIETLKAFSSERYLYKEEHSTPDRLVFVR